MAYSLMTLEKAKSQVAESFRTLRTNVQFTSVDSEIKSIMITSSGRGEGKSFTVSNYAVSMAQSGKSVIVVDADLRNPTQHKLFGIENGEGLSVVLAQNQDYRACSKETAVPGITVLTAGPRPPNPAELLGSKRMKDVIEGLSKKYDMVLFDTPPIIAVTDAAVLAHQVGGVILVLASGKVNREYAQKAMELLNKVDAKVLGAVLNKVQIKASDYSYYNYNNM